MIDPGDESLSVSRQCEFAGLSRSTFYFRPQGDGPENLRLMKVIDRYHMDYPAFGSRQIAHEFGIGRGRARRLMRNMGISARSSFSADQHPSGGACDLPLFAPQCCNHGSESCLVNRHNVHPHGLWLRLFDAVIDWHSRYVLSWRLSNTLDRGFCIEASESALSNGFKPEIFNTGQGSQYTSADFINVLKRYNIRISMDGRGRVLDNAFIERLWRTVKYEEIYLNHYDSVWELEDRLTAWFDFYCNRRRHSALNYCCLAELFFGWAVAGKESLQRA